MKKETKKITQPVETFGEYVLFSAEKLDRVINGVVGEGGRLFGGLGKEASPEDILVAYDKIGGLIKTKDGQKVETGSFYDFKLKKARKDVKLASTKNTSGSPKIIKEEVGDKEDKKKKKVENED